MIDFTTIMDAEVLWALLTALAVILIDLLMGVVLAISAGEFDVRKLPQALRTNVLPYIGSLLVLAIGAGHGAIAALFFAGAAATIAKFLAEIKDKAIKVFGKEFAE